MTIDETDGEFSRGVLLLKKVAKNLLDMITYLLCIDLEAIFSSTIGEFVNYPK